MDGMDPFCFTVEIDWVVVFTADDRPYIVFLDFTRRVKTKKGPTSLRAVTFGQLFFG